MQAISLLDKNAESCADDNDSSKVTNELPKRLAAFDFDQTIVNDNTDTVVRALMDPKKIPSSVQNLVRESWTQYMREIFSLLHDEKISEKSIRTTIGEMNEVPGMVKFIKSLHSMNFDLVIISDSNSEFIDEWNRVHGLSIFHRIFTNPASFSKNGLLKISPYHHQTDCKISAQNLCKGQVLEEFIKERYDKNKIIYENVLYIGDGTNDICPILKLSNKDYGCVRINYSMDKRLTKNPELEKEIKANLIKWSSGFEILEKISQIFNLTY